MPLRGDPVFTSDVDDLERLRTVFPNVRVLGVDGEHGRSVRLSSTTAVCSSPLAANFVGVTAAALSRERISFGPWLWGAPIDLALFAGSAFVSLAVLLSARALGIAPGPLPEWGWLVFVVAIDVAHVWSTLFRTYFDRQELARHKLRYIGVPIAVYLGGVFLHAFGSLWFWRVLAYMALFHFIRQQVGWVAVYRARSGERSWLDRVIDDAAVYASTLYPVLHWHSRVRATDFSWFVKGDFVDLGVAAARVLPLAKTLWIAALVAFFVRQVAVALKRGVIQTGKIVIVVTTAALWYVGIVATNSDFEFTVTNVIVHGVPYFGLLWAYARERKKEAPEALGSQIIGGGIGAFVGILLVFAFVEEMAWDKLIWHEREWLFDTSGLMLGPLVALFVVPLLALPQATHYVLDGVLWRRSDTRTRPAQRRALGFSG